MHARGRPVPRCMAEWRIGWYCLWFVWPNVFFFSRWEIVYSLYASTTQALLTFATESHNWAVVLLTNHLPHLLDVIVYSLELVKVSI